jgi:GTPase SAR1 family protein
MTIPISSLAKQIDPENTILLFGAGASIPSGAPSVADIVGDLSGIINESPQGYGFDEFCSLFEMKRSRRELVSAVRKRLKNLRPTGGLVNIADYDWKAIFTTNYDDLIEKCYLKKDRPIRVFSSNFDFGGSTPPDATSIFKLHGTVGHDVVDGHNSRMVLTSEDNELVDDYRERLFDRLKNDLGYANLVIVGYSLSDPDLKSIIQRAVRLRKESLSSQNIYLLLYSRDENRAQLFEKQGVRIAFGGVDDFFLEMSKASPSERKVLTLDDDILSEFPSLTPTTTDVVHEAQKPSDSFSAMYAGSPAQYPEIRAGLTFDRSVRGDLKSMLFGEKQFLTVLGASGVGKTTLARQVVLSLIDDDFQGWEHHPTRALDSEKWRSVAERLKGASKHGVLLLDDAHLYLPEVNSLVDMLVADENQHLKLILTSANNHWKPRLKSPNLTKSGKLQQLSKLDSNEIAGLLNLIQSNARIAKLVDKSFKGFAYQERKRRLTERCNRDFFVCLKNIFANDSFDNIVLREFSEVSEDYQGIYKYLCALESLGVMVHRQLLIRVLNIHAQDLGRILENLDGLVEEFVIDRRGSVFGWRGRHPVISDIITQYKFSDADDILKLMRRVVGQLSPSYDVEITTMRQLCSTDSGIRRIQDVGDQNEILRMMISAAPMERVPRHRLIANLIRQGAFNDADTEIRVFENDLRLDGPVRRHKVRLILERAISSTGLMPDDKAKLLNDAHDAAVALLEKFPNTPHTLRLFSDVCLEIFKVTADYTYVDAVRTAIKRAENETGDPEVTQALIAFERRLTRAAEIKPEFVTEERDTADHDIDIE